MNSHTGLAIVTLACITFMPNDLNAQQPVKDGAYVCTVEFSGGLAYNRTTKRWQSTTFRPRQKFILRLKFIETTQEELEAVSSYHITFTPAGESVAMPCRSWGRDVAVMFSGLQSVACSGARENCIFNFQNNRFLQGYMYGYVNGKDDNRNMPSMSGGTCTRIE